MKKVIITSILSLSSLLLVEYLYIQSSSTFEIIKMIKKIKQPFKEKPKLEINSDVAKKIKIVSVKTGFYASYLWFPSIKVKVQNISKKDLREYIALKVVFFDENKNEQIGSSTKYICTEGNLLLKDATLRKHFKAKFGYKEGIPYDTNIKAKLYLENTLIGTYKIKEREI